MASSTDVIRFHGSRSILSNFYPCEITYDGRTFRSVEHAYQFLKAKFHGLSDFAEFLADIESPYDLKSESNKIQCCPEWFGSKIPLMENLLDSKYEQIPCFRDFLCNTRKSVLLHDVDDVFWGSNNNGQNNFGRMLMDLRDRHSSEIKIAVFGSSYITRLDRFCNSDFKVPSLVKCFGRGGMRADRVPSDILHSVIRFRPDYVFVQLGGNDITNTKVPSDIVKDISGLVNTFKSNGVKDVFVGEIIPRGNFSKAPGVTFEHFNKVRKLVNKELRVLYGQKVIDLHRLKFPRDYKDDKVHLNDNGLKSYFLKLRRLFCSLKK